MQLRKSDFSNIWSVRGREVENIIIYDATGPLLDTGLQFISLPMSSRALNTFPGFTASTEIAARNTVKFDRPEHFFCKGVLYINASLFDGYGTVNRPRIVIDTERCQTAERAEIVLQIDDNEWTIAERCFSNYENTKLGDQADAVREIFNREVADHPNRHLSQWAAARLIRALPEMLEASKAAE